MSPGRGETAATLSAPPGRRVSPVRRIVDRADLQPAAISPAMVPKPARPARTIAAPVTCPSVATAAARPPKPVTTVPRIVMSAPTRSVAMGTAVAPKPAMAVRRTAAAAHRPAPMAAVTLGKPVRAAHKIVVVAVPFVTMAVAKPVRTAPPVLEIAAPAARSAAMAPVRPVRLAPPAPTTVAFVLVVVTPCALTIIKSAVPIPNA